MLGKAATLGFGVKRRWRIGVCYLRAWGIGCCRIHYLVAALLSSFAAIQALFKSRFARRWKWQENRTNTRFFCQRIGSRILGYRSSYFASIRSGRHEFVVLTSITCHSCQERMATSCLPPSAWHRRNEPLDRTSRPIRRKRATKSQSALTNTTYSGNLPTTDTNNPFPNRSFPSLSNPIRGRSGECYRLTQGRRGTRRTLGHRTPQAPTGFYHPPVLRINNTTQKKKVSGKAHRISCVC